MLYEIIALIVDTAAMLVAAAFLLRFWTQAARVRPPDPLARFIFTLSNWLVLPLRRLLPASGYDWASLIGAIVMAAISVAVPLLLASHFLFKLFLVASLQQLSSWIFYGFMGLLIIEAILSWVNPHAPLAPFVRGLNEPLLRPLRRIVPLIGGLDLSLLVALILLRIAMMFLNAGLVSLL